MKFLTIIGTRPEAVKMAPVLLALAERSDVSSLTADTGQHRDMLGPHLRFFGLEADFNLNLMRPGEDPRQQVERMSVDIGALIELLRPDRVMVQGDTSSALAGARAAAARGIPLAHVEAGLRTYAILPWPEEAFRREIDALSDELFAPTSRAAENVLQDGVTGTVHVTGNTGIDALHLALARQSPVVAPGPDPRPLILVTLHRRESSGSGTAELCAAIGEIAEAGTAQVVIPVHPNPAIRGPVHAALGRRAGVRLVPPLDYPAMIALMQRSDLILTDSGGVQEEAPSLGKRVLVLRDVTERPEGIELGLARLVGLRRDAIVAAVREALAAPALPALDNPYGDGRAAGRIVAALLGEPFAPFGAEEMPALRIAS